MRKMKKILAMLLALMMVLQMAPVVSAEGAAEKVAAIYVSDPSAIDATKVGYYWDATSIYYADGAEVKSYSLAAQGINLTDYNQIHAANIDGKAVNVQFGLPVGGLVLDVNANMQDPAEMTLVDGVATYDNETVIDETVSTADAAAVASYSSYNRPVLDHATKNLYLEQTILVEALPVNPNGHGCFIGNSTVGSGLTFYLNNRLDGGADHAMLASVQNDGDGKLVLYIANGNTFSGYGNLGVDLGVKVGEQFILGTQWNMDGSADIYVNNGYVGSVTAATRVLSYAVGGHGYGVRYGNLTGDAKFSISNVKVYNGIPKSIAEDTAAATLEEIVAAANLSVVTGNVTLPTAIEYVYGAMPITWATSDASVITADGKVTVAKEDKTATLTASAVGQTVEVNVTVPGSYSYVADYATDISAVTKAGYYWDAQNLYYYNGELTTYALADMGITLTDYNQSVKATIGGKTMNFLFAPSKGAPIATFAADDNTMYVPGWVGFAADGANIVYDSSVATGVECSADSRSNIAVNHANDLYLEQTFKFDALPVKGVSDHGVFLGNSTMGTGFTFYMGIRPNATGAGYSDTFVASIQNEGDGALAIYIANQNTNSGYGTLPIALGVNVGEEFVLGTQWNADGSADIYVNDSYITSVTNATRELGWAVGTGNFYGVRYNNLPGDAKFTISNIAVYGGIVTSVAEDTAVATLDELVAALDLSAVKGNIDLPAQVTYAHGAMPITWTSSNPDVLAADGTLVAMPKVDTTVTLTASCAGKTATAIAIIKADAVYADAVYAASVDGAADGYYWDAFNLYYVADGVCTTYALADLGVALTDYNQTKIVMLDGAQVNVTFKPGKGIPAVVLSGDNGTMNNNYFVDFVADGADIVFDSENATVEDFGYAQSRNNAALTHSKDLYLEQTYTIESLPANVYGGGVFIGNTACGHGLTFYLSNRDNSVAGEEIAMLASIQSDENGNLALYIANNGTYSSGCSGIINLDVKVGETFTLGTQWNTDDSVDVYVNGAYKGSAQNATRKIYYSIGTGNIYGVMYRVTEGAAKFTVSDISVYYKAASSVAEDTAEVSFADLIAGLDLSAVNTSVVLPTQVIYSCGAFPINWTSSNPEILTADGKLVAVPEKDTAVTLTATYMGQSVDVVATVLCGNAAAGNDFTNILPMHATEGYGTPQSKVNVTIDGATIVYDNETTIDESVTVTNTEAPNADIHYYSRPEYVDHTKYDILLEQTVCIEALPVNPNQTGVFVGNALTARGMLIYMSDRYDEATAAEHAMLASIQNMGDGKLAIMFANNGTFSSGSADWMMLDKNLGDTFVLGILWKKDDTAVVYVDGIEIGVVANVNRPYNWKGTDVAGIKYDSSYLPGDVKFTVTDFTLYTMGNLAAVGETEYNNLQAALDAAANGETVTMIDNVYTSDIMIPEGVTLDINGNAIVADNIVSFGDLLDNNAQTRGSVAVSGALQLEADNAQLPVYHNDYECYYLGDAQVKGIGTKASENKVTFGFGPKFEDSYLYHVMSKPAVEGSDADCGLSVQITLDWTGNEGDALVFEMSEELIRKYGELAYAYDNIGLVAAMMLNVSGVNGLEIGSNVIVDVTVTSDTGVVMTGETMYYEIAG